MRPRRSWIVEDLECRALLAGLISYSVTTDQTTYQVGQPIQMTFTETNIGDQPDTVDVIPTDFEAFPLPFIAPLWQSDPDNQGAAPTSQTLQPGQSLTQTATWDGSTTAFSGSATNLYGTYAVTNLNAPQGMNAVFNIASPLQDTLTTDRSTYQFGQPVQITFTRTNTSDEPVPLSLGMAQDSFQVTQGGQMVWQSDQGPPYTFEPFDYPQNLQPGQSWTKTVTWDGWINGTPAWLSPETTAESATGSFSVTSELNPSGPSASFQIQSPLTYNLQESQINLQFGQPNAAFSHDHQHE